MGSEVQLGLETTCSGDMLRIMLGLDVGQLPGLVLAAPLTSCWSWEVTGTPQLIEH